MSMISTPYIKCKHLTTLKAYCKTLNIFGVRFSRFNENDLLGHFNFGVNDIPWLQIVEMI